ncbi:alpha/beta-hydrolase [Decorospora gaudefroyi]|uniref:Alpha/beta-hydrolase n=1 Tax=Decorospora gaudefroyi TaxID=184978 RepID=A0A6A5KAC8_9PLEO|nr:alpha/beta-hydrolase [Decorospora gaudefroyi]
MSKPTRTNEESKQIAALQDRVGIRESKLKNIVGNDYAALPKWDWPEDAMKIVKEAQKDAIKNRELVTRHIRDLYTWPSEDLANEKVFLEGKGAFSTFTRSRAWFEEEGFHEFTTNYSFSNRWDKTYLPATFLVPKVLVPGHKAPVMWYFHGGGYCTGASDGIPWYSQTAMRRAKNRGAIVIGIDYPLGPEGNYKDIVDSLGDFLAWYKADKSFDPNHTSWTDWLYKQTPNLNYTLDKSSVYIEGESAGGQAAVTTIWLNAKKGGPNLPIDAALLRFPMIEHYTRSWEKSANKQNKAVYMGLHCSKTEAEQRVANIKAVILDLERRGLVPTIPARYPPVGMAFAFLLSITGEWTWFFQRQHDERIHDMVAPTDTDFMDGLGRINNSVQDVVHECLPPMYVYHGHDDGNCPVEGTANFVNRLRELYPTRYGSEKGLVFHIVRVLAKKLEVANPMTGELKTVENATSVGHGFDYSLDEKNEKFLKEAYDWVGGFWGRNG